MKIRLRKSDVLYSKYIREKANWICARCRRDFSNNRRALHASHFWGRRHENTRFCEDNVDALCFFDHQYLGENPGEFKDWKFKQLGEKKYKALEIAHHIYKKRDDKMDYLYVKTLYERFQKENRIQS